MSDDLQEEFYCEEVQDGPVERPEQLSIPFRYRRVGLQSDDDAAPIIAVRMKFWKARDSTIRCASATMGSPFN
jgi:hypothetical protein